MARLVFSQSYSLFSMFNLRDRALKLAVVMRGIQIEFGTYFFATFKRNI